MRTWIEGIRESERRTPHSYPSLDSAVARMKEANSHLSDDVARHLTLHGTNWNADGSLAWKFDHYTRVLTPFGLTLEDVDAFMGAITCPVLLFWGRQSFARDPEIDPQAQAIRGRSVVKVDQAGHWLHHDQPGIFLQETAQFLRA